MYRSIFLSIILYLLPIVAVLAQEKSPIEFLFTSLEETQQLAQKRGKIIFIDAYTTWCAPCVKMDKEVFPDKEISGFFNANFLNLKIDLDSEFGKRFAEQYQVIAYPTFLFLDKNGTVVHRATGFFGKDDFLSLAEKALDPDRNLKGYARRFAAGDRNPAFLYDYAAACMLAKDNKTGPKVADAYMATLSDWNTPKNRAFIFTFLDDPETKIFDFFATHREDFEAQFGKKMVNGKIQHIILGNSFQSGLSEEDSFKKMNILYQKVYPGQAEQLMAQFRMNYFSYQGNNEKFLNAAIDYYEKYEPLNASELNNIAWQFFEKTTDKSKLQYALAWAERSVEIDSQYYNLDTLAWIYFKMGNKEKAKETAERAIYYAKSMGSDFSTTQKLLDQL